MNQQEVTARISNLLDAARTATEEALSLGREYGVAVDLGKIGIGAAEDMWYVTKQEWIDEQIEELKYYHDEDEMEAAIAEIHERAKAIEEEGGYDNGYKVWGWMSSSTNC